MTCGMKRGLSSVLIRACNNANRITNPFLSLSLSLKPYSSSTYFFSSTKTLESDTNNNNNNKRSILMEEEQVGICCYISQLPGFRGILKHRYSDFIVNEVDSSENVVHLTNLDAPHEVSKEKDTQISDELNLNYDSQLEIFKSIAGDSDANSLSAFLQQINSGDKDNLSPIILSPRSDKAHRTLVHNFFKEHLKFLVTDTVDGPDSSSKRIRVWLKAGGNNQNGKNSKKRKDRGEKPYDRRGSDDWPENLDKFLRFNLCKENKDTQEALGLIGRMLGINTRSFGFAGTKDKRGITTQRVTVFKQQAGKLAALNKRLIGIKLGDFCYVKEGLVLGQLYGNRFTITLRGIIADSETTVRESAEALAKHGFINYFGLQRFGSGSIPTHLIGASLFKGEWKTAVNMILDPREGEKESIKKTREYYKESNDIDGTLRQLPRFMVAEKAILQCLKNNPGNFLQALKAIPRTLRMMYVHSYQSYLWNHAASLRVQRYGMDQVVVGDLVYIKGACTEKAIETCSFEGVDESSNDTYECSQLDEIIDTILPEEKNISVKVVDEQDLVAGHYTIEDVILPLPGSRVIYPTNDVGKVFQDLAMKDGVSLTESAHIAKEFSITSMTGGYRRVFQKPKDFEWELIKYTDGNIPLAQTDLDIVKESLNGSYLKRGDNISNGHDVEEVKQFKDSNDVDSRQKQPENSISNDVETKMALKMSFTLPASCYATMAIRELLKTSTSTAFHKTLND